MFCLYTLLLCIALLHATAAPTQYRPLTGNTVLYGVRAASVHSDTITDMALCGPQTSYADYFKDKLVNNANISYRCPLQACEFEVCTKLPPTDLWLESQQTLIPSKDPRSLHADDCSIARISLTSLWCDSAGTFLKVPTANESSFRQSIYSGGPVSQEQQFTQYADYGKLTQVMDSNKSSQARSRSQPFRSSFNLPIAAGASRQHRQITGYPMNASVADSQSWRSNLKVSAIVVPGSGPQSSSARLRNDFTRQASRTVKGVTTNTHADSIKATQAGAWTQYEMLQAVDTCIHANNHQTPHKLLNMSNMQTAVDDQSRPHDTSILLADKMTTYMDTRQCTSVSSTHTRVNNYVLTPRRPIDVVKWHNAQMAVAVSHLYTSLENVIVPMLPSRKPDFVWIFADDLYIVRNGLLPSIEVPFHWHQHCHDTMCRAK